MRRSWATALAIVVASCCVAALPASGAASRPGRVASTSSPAQSRYLALAEYGLDQAKAWASGDWYCEYLGCGTSYPLLTVWGAAQLFEAVDAIALTDPSRANIARVNHFAHVGESYWNPSLQGYSPYPNDRLKHAELWFDDNGWLGLAFLNAYRATHDGRYLSDANRAYRFILANGWDPAGGMWWNTDHPYHSGEALAADSLLGVLLYGADHQRSQLDSATKFIDWANEHDTGYDRLYMSGGPGSTVIDYIQAPLIYAQQMLCTDTGQERYCQIAAEKSRRLTHLWGIRYDLAPQYDSIFLQWMMAYDQASDDTHWLSVAQANAQAATRHAANSSGLWLNGWWGTPITDPETHPGMIRTLGGTTSLYAWLAYYEG